MFRGSKKPICGPGLNRWIDDWIVAELCNRNGALPACGGWKSLLILCGGYLLLLGTGLGIFYYVDISSSAQTGITRTVVTLTLMLEALVLVVVGSMRVATAIRTDLNSKMIESHRLMPVPAWRAVAGYMLGAGAHPLVFALMNVMIAYVFAFVTSTNLVNVTINQAALFSFAALMWVMSCLATFYARQAFAIGLAAVIFGGCTFGIVGLYMLLPGFALLLSPVIGNSILSYTPASGALVWGYPACFLSQTAVFALMFAGACRRYRGTYLTTFTVMQSILVVVVWCAISAVGYWLWPEFHLMAGIFGPRGPDFPATRESQVVASMIVGMLLCLLPLRTMTFLAEREKILNWQATIVLVVLTLSLGCIGIGALGEEHATIKIYEVSLLTAGAFVATAYAILQMLRRALTLVMVLTVIGVGLILWFVPLMLEVLRLYLTVRVNPEGADLGVMGTLSPVGMLILAWTHNSPVSFVPGLIFMWVVAGILLGLVVTQAMRGKKGTVLIPPVVAVPVAESIATGSPHGPASS